MQRLRFFTICALLFLMIAAWAEQPRSDIHKKVLRVGTTGDYPPFTYYDVKTGKFSGIDIERALALGKYLERRVVFIKTTWPNLSADLIKNKFDIAMGGISASPERKEKFLLSYSVLIDGKVPLTLCNTIEKYDALEKINQPTVRVVENRGGTNEAFARQFLPQAKLLLLENNVDTIQALLTGKADVMITDKAEALYRQKMVPMLCVVNPDHPLTMINKVYLVPKTDVKLLEQVNRWIKANHFE